MKKKLLPALKTLVMRLFTACLLSCWMHSMVFASGVNAQKLEETIVSFSSNEMGLSESFVQIERQSGFKFSYETGLDLTTKVSYSRRKTDLQTILEEISRQSNLKFKQINNTIAVSTKKNFVVPPLQAAEVRLSGIVIDEETGETLPGVNIIIKGTTTGTTTDLDGKFAITVDEAAVLIFSYVGYDRQEVQAQNQTNLTIRLRLDSDVLGEVVVTALGIKREEKALGYATQKVDSEQLLDARSNNWSDALRGKVAGLNVLSAGSGPMNSSQISLRGDNSLNPNGNFALIVVDGVPMNSGLTSSGVSNAYGAGSGNDVPVDFGNGIADLNPDDIESINVLKGASATALYGSRAANGALIVTTKSGSRRTKGLGVTINSNFSFQNVLKWPERQYEYGQGTGKSFNVDGDPYYSYGVSEDGSSTGGTSSAFGPKFNGQSYFQYDPTLEGQSAERQLWRPYEDNVTGFWETGFNMVNSVALEGANEGGSLRASITQTKNEWIMPNTGFERLVASLSASQQISKRLKLNAKVNYTNKSSDNLPATGYNNQSIAYFMIFQNPSIDLEWYRPIWKEGQKNVEQVHPFSSFIDNPYLIAYEMTNTVNNNSVFGNLSANYTFSDHFELMVRTSLAMSQEERQQQRPYSTANFRRGYFKEQNITNYEQNSDFLFTYNGKLAEKISLRASVGANHMSRKFRMMSAYVDGLVIPGVYKLANGINNPVFSTNDNNRVINSLYGLMTLDFDEKVFVDITGRNDWSSTLPVQNNSFFYPSVSTSFVLSDIFSLPSPISFAKLRVSGAQVGNDTDPYRTSKYYGQSEFPGSASVPSTLYNVAFKPEITTSFETGLEMIFFNRRLGFDVNYYISETKNQILQVPVDVTTGYSSAILNAGKVQNRGIELVLNGSPIKTNNFQWNSFITWAKNENEVLSLPDEVDGSQVIGYGGNATIIAKVGGTTGDIYGFGFVRSPEGEIVYGSNGLPARPSEIEYQGNAYAKWKGGLRNEFVYKNLRMSILFDGQYGGIVYSQTHHKMTEMGKLKSTLEGRETGMIVGDGVVDNGDGTFSPNTTQVNIADYYRDKYRRANVESNSFDASFLKLREMRLEYGIPVKFLQKTSIRQASIALYGRDLAMWTKFPVFDPETAALNGGTLLPGIEMGQLPSTRNMGVNLTLKF
ncbi:SusC/RagA family TonB-linked outer membrane protein [Algoriphagus sp. D3-2-R+10]|uniref:SusC/RagA family TonB-linked outer membrane protein n=1 Tax=Algoriphagus aurantiacus TaxID=3103948 RepID=UPI002B3851E3|nr:SusC/RagA family TonB-linked outer membrane protein [Algoriphagus sp. D3-2-R+10]MEB2774444.1 SusC/RagA family TonB-linked outer membrane protein [Algoriphagus sp. D3-2-R+10]